MQDDFVSGRIRGVVATTAFGMGIDKPDVRLVCLFNYPDSLESYVQMVGRGGRDGAPSETLLLASPSDATAVRRFAVGDIPGPDDLRRVYRAIRDLGGTVEPDPARLPATTIHACSSGCSSRRASCGAATTPGRAMRDRAARRRAGSRRGRRRPPRALRRARRRRASSGSCDFAESDRCRHAQVAEHFGETLEPPCGACDVCDPPRAPRRCSGRATPLPADVAGTIVRAVERLTLAARAPLARRDAARIGVGSAVGACLASPSALLEAASDAEVKRWIKALEAAGALVEVETDDGFRVLRAAPGRSTCRRSGPKTRRPGRTTPSSSGCAPGGASARARTACRPTSCSTTRRCATSPRRDRASLHELAAVKGFGPTKIERYGDDVLELVDVSRPRA